MKEEGLGLARLHIPGLGRSYIGALLREGYDNRKCLQELGEEELAKVVPKRLAGRIKRRFSAETKTKNLSPEFASSPPQLETLNLPPASCLSSPPPRRGRTKVGVSLNTNDQQLTINPPCNSQLASCTLQPILEIDQHRPDRIIFEGKEVELTPLAFSLLYLLAQNPKEVLIYDYLINTIWDGSRDATYTQITFHLSKIRRAVLKTLCHNKRNRKKVKEIFKVISRRGIMLNLAEDKLKIS